MKVQQPIKLTNKLAEKGIDDNFFLPGISSGRFKLKSALPITQNESATPQEGTWIWVW